MLTGDAGEIADYLRRRPGEWFLIATSGRERGGVLKQTAHRIRSGKLAAFPLDGAGRWEVRTTAARDRPDAVADVEMVARWSPTTPA